MIDIQILANLAEILGGVAVIFGVGFGVMEYRRYRVQERKEAAASLARSFQTKELSTAIRVVMELPKPLDFETYKSLSESDKNAVWLMFTSLESIGLLTYRGDLPIELVDDLFSGPITDGWLKLRPYVETLQRDVYGPQTWEWFQWLNEKINERHEKTGRIPGYQRGKA